MMHPAQLTTQDLLASFTVTRSNAALLPLSEPFRSVPSVPCSLPSPLVSLGPLLDPVAPSSSSNLIATYSIFVSSCLVFCVCVVLSFSNPEKYKTGDFSCSNGCSDGNERLFVRGGLKYSSAAHVRKPFLCLLFLSHWF